MEENYSAPRRAFEVGKKAVDLVVNNLLHVFVIHDIPEGEEKLLKHYFQYRVRMGDQFSVEYHPSSIILSRRAA